MEAPTFDVAAGFLESFTWDYNNHRTGKEGKEYITMIKPL